MVKITFCLFNSLQTNDGAVKKVRSNNSTANRAMVALVLATAVYAVSVDFYCYMQDKMIVKLTNEIEELKRMKGE